jgi:hypothetical protein
LIYIFFKYTIDSRHPFIQHGQKLPKSAHKAAKMSDFLLLNDTNLFFTQNLRKKLAVKSFRERQPDSKEWGSRS